jgi:hypothetical protein
MLHRHNSNTLNVVWLTLGAMLLVVFARLGLEINLPVTLLLAISVVPALLGTPSQFLAMAITFIPLATTFQYKYALVLYLIIGIIRFRKLISISKVVPIIIMLMVWELAHHGLNGAFSFTEYLRSFAELLFLGFITSIKWEKFDFKVIARALAAATIGASLIIIYIHVNSGLENFMDMMTENAEMYRFGQNTIEDGEVPFSLNFNPNQLGFICNISIASLLMLIARKEHSTIDIVMICTLIFVGLLTLSRTFVAVATFIFLSFMFLSPGAVKQRAQNIILLLVVVPILLFVVFEYAPSIIEGFSARNDTNDITNGRSFLMEFFHNHIFSSFKHCFWGIGLQEYGLKILSLYGRILVCHNGIQEVWVTWGFVGLLIFMFMMLSMISTSRRWSGNRTFFVFIPLCALLFNSMAGQLVSSGTMMLSLSLVYIVMCIKWDKTPNQYVQK